MALVWLSTWGLLRLGRRREDGRATPSRSATTQSQTRRRDHRDLSYGQPFRDHLPETTQQC